MGGQEVWGHARWRICLKEPEIQYIPDISGYQLILDIGTQQFGSLAFFIHNVHMIHTQDFEVWPLGDNNGAQALYADM